MRPTTRRVPRVTAGPRGGGAERALLLRHPAGRLRVGLHRLQQGVPAPRACASPSPHHVRLYSSPRSASTRPLLHVLTPLPSPLVASPTVLIPLPFIRFHKDCYESMGGNQMEYTKMSVGLHVSRVWQVRSTRFYPSTCFYPSPPRASTPPLHVLLRHVLLPPLHVLLPLHVCDPPRASTLPLHVLPPLPPRASTPWSCGSTTRGRSRCRC